MARSLGPTGATAPAGAPQLVEVVRIVRDPSDGELVAWVLTETGKDTRRYPNEEALREGLRGEFGDHIRFSLADGAIGGEPAAEDAPPMVRASWDALFQEQSRRKVFGGGKTTGADRILWQGTLAGRRLAVCSTVRLRDRDLSFRIPSNARIALGWSPSQDYEKLGGWFIDLEVRPDPAKPFPVPDTVLARLASLAQDQENASSAEAAADGRARRPRQVLARRKGEPVRTGIGASGARYRIQGSSLFEHAPPSRFLDAEGPELGQRVRVTVNRTTSGPRFVGRTGVLLRTNALDPSMGYVRLDPVPRERTEKVELFHLANLSRPNGPRVLVVAECSKTKHGTARPAERLYAGRSHSALMAGVERLRRAADVEVKIVSAKHGLIAGNTAVAPYEESLAGKSRAELAELGRRLGVPDAVRAALAEPHDVAVIVLSEPYLRVAGLIRTLPIFRARR